MKTEKNYIYAYADDGKPDGVILIIDDPLNYVNEGYRYYYKCE